MPYVDPEKRRQAITRSKAKADPEHVRRRDAASARKRYATEAGRAKAQDKNKRALYRLSQEQLDSLRHQQGGRCAICRLELQRGRGPACEHVDHDHLTGKVRGLLCTGCNLGLGHMSDNPERLRQAALYLETRQ